MKKKAGKPSVAAVQADTLVSFMRARGLRPHPWAQAAGIRSSTIYNLLAGKSKTLSSDTLQKLARAAGASVDELLGHVSEALARSEPASTSAGTIAVRWVVGAFGRLHPMNETEITYAPAPPGIDHGRALEAARVDADALRPIPGGWVVMFEQQGRPPSELLGTLAVVRVRTSPDPLIREIRRGSVPGLFALMSLNSPPMEDVEIVSAHRIAAFVQAT